MRKEVLEEAGEGKHWFAGMLGNKAKKKCVFRCRSASFCSVYNRGIVVDKSRVVIDKSGDLRVGGMGWLHHRQRAKNSCCQGG